MKTIPRHLSLVPACPYTFAISLAIVEVEKRLQGRAARGAHPYASAFVRHYCGTRTTKADQLRRIMHEYTPGDRLRGNTWLRLIRLLPHAVSAALRRCRRILAQGCFR